MSKPKDENDLGALWVNAGANGDYMTGEINGVKVVCFRNKSDNPKAPQWRVLKSRPKPPRSEADDSDVPF